MPYVKVADQAKSSAKSSILTNIQAALTELRAVDNQIQDVVAMVERIASDSVVGADTEFMTSCTRSIAEVSTARSQLDSAYDAAGSLDTTKEVYVEDETDGGC
jgi:hypothetical protein